MTRIPRPEAHEYAPYYARYLEQVPEGDLPGLLEAQLADLDARLAPLGDTAALRRYAPGKWSLKEVVGHLADAERIWAYRLLRIARGDATPLPGFEEDDYVRAAEFDRLPLIDLLAEFRAVRIASLALLRHLEPRAFAHRGSANGQPVSAAAVAHLLYGHAAHHLEVLRTRYGV